MRSGIGSDMYENGTGPFTPNDLRCLYYYYKNTYLTSNGIGSFERRKTSKTRFILTASPPAFTCSQRLLQVIDVTFVENLPLPKVALDELSHNYLSNYIIITPPAVI